MNLIHINWVKYIRLTFIGSLCRLLGILNAYLDKNRPFLYRLALKNNRSYCCHNFSIGAQ